LPATRRAEEGEELAVEDVQVELAQRGVVAVALDDLAQFDSRTRRARRRRFRDRHRLHRHPAPIRTIMRTSCLGCGIAMRKAADGRGDPSGEEDYPGQSGAFACEGGAAARGARG